MDIVRATYDFAAQHPEVLKYVPCFCGCGSQGHKANESCFVARRDPRGNVLEWDTHGFGCTICIDVAREACSSTHRAPTSSRSAPRSRSAGPA
jgi:sarcosine oxidase delta subunit